MKLHLIDFSVRMLYTTIMENKNLYLHKERIMKSLEEGTKTKLEICQEFGIMYNTLQRNLKKWSFDESKFKRIKNSVRRPLEDYIGEKQHPIGSNALKKKLLKENYKEEKCEDCGRKTWSGAKIPLELHHMDGNRFNNKLENLRILCPNCHSLTENHRGKAKPRRGDTLCLDCQIKIYRGSKRCKSCNEIFKASNKKKKTKSPKEKLPRPAKIQWPEVSTLLKMLEKDAFITVAKRLGVSDNAIRKHLKHRGVNPNEHSFYKQEKPKPEHGTHARYRKHGCRCNTCVDARRLYRTEYLAKNRDEVNAKRREKRKLDNLKKQ
jgi:hypothetical protein